MGKIVVKAVPNSVRICVIALSINAFRLIINLFNQEQCDNTNIVIRNHIYKVRQYNDLTKKTKTTKSTDNTTQNTNDSAP